MLSVTLLAWSKSSRGMKVRGVARVGAYLGVVGLVAGVFATHNAHASVAEGSLQFGRDMMELKEYIQAPTAFTLNGEKMVLATGTSDKKAHDILDSYETYCRAAKGSLGKEWSDLAAQPLSSHETKVASKLGGAFDMGVYRVEHDGEGSVMCFMRSEGTQKNLLTSLQAFEHTHDLGSLGKMRYAYVRALSDGRSMVFTAWTDEHFRLDSFIPNGKQDAAGTDASGLPRPPESQRLLSAELDGSPFGTHVYRTQKSPDEVRGYYDGEMVKRGFVPLGWYDESIDPGKNRMYLKDGAQIALSTKTDSAGTLVSIGELAAAPKDSMK